eukprot:12889243-Prorocentrum_lima.AAC.1
MCIRDSLGDADPEDPVEGKAGEDHQVVAEAKDPMVEKPGDPNMAAQAPDEHLIATEPEDPQKGEGST